MQIITFSSAKKQGLPRYYTGKPCPRGHTAERLVNNRGCSVCHAAIKQAWEAKHRARLTAEAAGRRAKNPERVREIKRAYYQASETERANQAIRAKRWLEANREKSRAATASYRKRNLAKAAAAQQRRRAKLLQRTPSWADHEKILQFYIQARELTEQTGIEHEVDHIYPLQGELVSGLHVETNLQVIQKSVNRSKGARLPAHL